MYRTLTARALKTWARIQRELGRIEVVLFFAFGTLVAVDVVENCLFEFIVYTGGCGWGGALVGLDDRRDRSN